MCSSAPITPQFGKDAVFFAHRNNRDLCYSGLNVTLVKAFLSAKKKKKIHPETGKVTLSSVSDIKKYDDAIKWGSLQANQPLPSTYSMKWNCSFNHIKRSIK